VIDLLGPPDMTGTLDNKPLMFYKLKFKSYVGTESIDSLKIQFDNNQVFKEHYFDG
jgi:hypothetical protein